MAPAALAPNGMPSTPLTELPPTSAFEAQAKLFPRLRQFYGGTGALRGLVPILMLMVGPFKVIPGFLRLTARANEPMRRRIAWNGFLLSTATVLVLSLFGYRLLVNFNIPLTAIMGKAMARRPPGPCQSRPRIPDWIWCCNPWSSRSSSRPTD